MIDSMRKLLSRRQLVSLFAVAALLFGLAMLHPYPRQSLFGPTIRGEPWCVWEDAIRRHAHWDKYEKTTWAIAMRRLGVKETRPDFRELFDNEEMLPLLLELMEDPDPVIRQRVLKQFYWHKKLQDKCALPRLRARLADDDVLCQIEAACAIRAIEPAENVYPLLLRILDDPQSRHRFEAMRALTYMASSNSLAFDAMTGYVNDPSPKVRADLMYEIYRLGVRGIPTLAQGVKDPDASVRKAAVFGLECLAPEDKNAIAPIARCYNDPDKNVRLAAREALRTFDPELFQHLQATEK